LKLVLELFGEGNIILVSEKGEILHALAYKRMRDRNVLRGETFVFAPSSGLNPFKVSREELRDGLRGFGDVEVVRGLVRFLSIGGVYAEEVLLRAEVEKTKPCITLSNSNIDAVFDALQSLLAQVSSGTLEPCIVLDAAGEFADVLPFRLRRFESFTTKPFSSFGEALDEFYVRVSAAEQADATASVEVEALKREAERLKRVIASQEKVVAEAEAAAEKEKHIGDVIYAHVGELQTLLDRFLTDKTSGKEWNAILSQILTEKKTNAKPWMFFESFDAKSLFVIVRVDGVDFGLDLRKSLFDNAGRFYERSKRAKQKLEGAQTALKESQEKLAKVEAKMREAQDMQHTKPAEALRRLAEYRVKRKEWFEKFRWFVCSDGFLVVAGRDAVSNEVLIKKHTEPNDVVFHADIAGAPFVVVKTGGKEPSMQCLREAGEFAAAFSRGWRENFASVDVYWVSPEQLSKTAPSGEYVAHGAFVVSGKRNWMRNVPLKAAIGVVVNGESGEMSFVGGPVDAVKTKTKDYATIVPGEQSGKELLKNILKSLSANMPKELREKILKTSIEKIRDFIPYSKGRIVKT
jgi:predicted ribosome quality control (RQC) complex YloA/Tae2 family protein